MRPLGLSRGSIRLVRTVSNGGRSAKTRFRCIRPSTSRGRGRALTLCEDTTRLPGGATQARQGPLGEGRKAKIIFAREESPSPKSPRRQLPAGPEQGNVSMVETAGLSTTRARGILLRLLLRGLVIGPSGTSPCTLGTATTVCMASTPLSNANTCIRSRLQVNRWRCSWWVSHV